MISWYIQITSKTITSKFNKFLTSFWILDYALNPKNANLTQQEPCSLALLSLLMVLKWIQRRSLLSKTRKPLPVFETSSTSSGLLTFTYALLKDIPESVNLSLTYWKRIILSTGNLNVNRSSTNSRNNSGLPQSWSTLTPHLKLSWKPIPLTILYLESCNKYTSKMARQYCNLWPFCQKRFPLRSIIMELEIRNFS